ncbi:protein Lines homolog 1 [Notolabrus celidotus]|uniref:protein Lines homolog 1 n=1 Tax=Notolabrus celidotus TaxID=1203425 RepID=UPI00148FBB68|nr:protein Lines homolog 1 [Notolabrus celidotus]
MTVGAGRASSSSRSSMELTVSSGDHAGDSLTQVYSCFLMGSSPGRSAAEVADLVLSGMCGREPGEDMACCHDNSTARSSFSPYISLSLVARITRSLTSQSFNPAVKSYSEEVMRVMLEDMDLMSHLVHHFQSEDQIISHLAAKSVSVCVFYVLQTSGTISPVMRQTCEQAFHSSVPGTMLDACLWSLTEVFKNLLKGAHQEIFGRLLAAFDSSLSSLCSDFLPEDRRTRCSGDFTSSRLWETTLCLLLDLLEVLTASTLICGASVSLRSQRLTHIHSSALLETISGSSEYFVRKRAVLLLKRTVLQKAGEDWASGEVLLSGLKHEHFSSDMNRLAQSVLTAVAADWLKTVHVESASFFGGTRAIRDEDQKPDCVMLRGVSLLLLKTTELHIQSAAGSSSAAEVYRYLQSLWSFLRRFSVELSEAPHRCCWVSLLFGDQDDDMIEAAKTSLSIFLHHRRCSGLDDSAELEAACASGNNPHCIFLLLLQSISFDHSILLDFLISTETCFLEYFVRYLKYLTANWQGFAAACRRISESDCCLSLQQCSPAACGADAFESTVKVESFGPRLVQYGSSGESDPEDMEVVQDELRTFVHEKSISSVLEVKQEISGPIEPVRQKQDESSLNKANSALEREAEGSSSQTLHSEQTGPNLPPLSGQETCETSHRAVLCVTQLREVVTRLQAKKLFPYNPSSLLKLLAQVEKCSQQNHPSHCNKS